MILIMRQQTGGMGVVGFSNEVAYIFFFGKGKRNEVAYIWSVYVKNMHLWREYVVIVDICLNT